MTTEKRRRFYEKGSLYDRETQEWRTGVLGASLRQDRFSWDFSLTIVAGGQGVSAAFTTRSTTTYPGVGDV